MLATKFFSVIAALTLLNGAFACFNPAVVDLIQLNFYFTATQHQVYNVHNFHQILEHPSFRHDRNLIVYTHGWQETLQTPSIIDLIEAYVHYDNVNVVFANFLNSAQTYVMSNMCTIGENIAAALVRTFDGGFSPSHVHLLGFSQGGMGSGLIAREIQIQSGDRYTVERLTALDHAGAPAGAHRITPDFARYVETILTSIVADRTAVGHANFFVNGGTMPPQCTTAANPIECAHLFVVLAWTESVRTQAPIFPSLQCESLDHFQRNDCTPGVVGNMGLYTSPALRGNFFLRTNPQSPFSVPVPGP